MKTLSGQITGFVKGLKPTVRQAILPTLLATLIFLMTWRFFGMENTMIGPFATLSFLLYRTAHNHYEYMIRIYGVYIAMAVMDYFAVMNFPLCIVINAAALFWIAYILIDEYNPTNYFHAAMALIFFQIAPVHTPAALANRITALLATFVLTFLFVFLLSMTRKDRDPLSGYLREGFTICSRILQECEKEDPGKRDEELFAGLHKRIHEVNRQISSEIYAFNRVSLRRWDKTNFYCHFILVFQVINYLTLDTGSRDNVTKARLLYDDFKSEFERVKPSAYYHRLNFRLVKPDIRSFRLRFALRQVITVTPCLVFAWAVQLPNVYWLVISVYFMMIPYTDQTMKRVRQRVLGTISGILICLVLFSVFPGFPARVVIMTIANFLIYSANGYGPTVAYITCSALAVQTIDMAVPMVLGQRLIYTLIGAGIALAANHLVFPIRMRNQMRYQVETICKIRKEMADLAEHTVPGDPRRRKELDQRIVKSYIVFKRMEELYDSLPEKTKREMDDGFDYMAFRREHLDFIAGYMSRYLVNFHDN